MPIFWEQYQSRKLVFDYREFEGVGEETKAYSVPWVCENKCGLCKSEICIG